MPCWVDCLTFNNFISFQIFKEGGPSASADFQGALRLHYNIILIKKKTLITKT